MVAIPITKRPSQVSRRSWPWRPNQNKPLLVDRPRPPGAQDEAIGREPSGKVPGGREKCQQLGLPRHRPLTRGRIRSSWTTPLRCFFCCYRMPSLILFNFRNGGFISFKVADSHSLRQHPKKCPPATSNRGSFSCRQEKIFIKKKTAVSSAQSALCSIT